jgi:hypothetical protein
MLSPNWSWTMRLLVAEIEGFRTLRSDGQTVKLGELPQFFGSVVVLASSKLRLP